MPDIPSPSVLLPRAAYRAVVLAAQAVARNPDELPALLHAIDLLVAEQEKNDITAEDQTTLVAARTGLVGDDGGYFSLAHHDERGRNRIGVSYRLLWKGTGDGGLPKDIWVVDGPPIPSERIDSLVRKGRLDPLDVFGLKQSPFKAFTTRVHWKHYGGEWTFVTVGAEAYRGAWLVSGGGDVIAWVPDSPDAEYLADCASSIIRLERDVRRYSGPPNPGFPRYLKTGGLSRLIDMLVASINPIERFEAEPPAKLAAAGRRLASDLRQFCSDSAPHRFGEPRPPNVTRA
jgi:hypothetical protein